MAPRTLSGPSNRPVRLQADASAQSLTVGWADGATSTFSYEGLRRACPCAECRGGHGKMAEPVDPVVFSIPSLMTYEIKELRPSGHYALQIVWGDGHDSGLFRWELLRGYGDALEG
ncbi:MAG: DUF971 domain-containing protein [Rubrivirga sp.]